MHRNAMPSGAGLLTMLTRLDLLGPSILQMRVLWDAYHEMAEVKKKERQHIARRKAEGQAEPAAKDTKTGS